MKNLLAMPLNLNPSAIKRCMLVVTLFHSMINFTEKFFALFERAFGDLNS
jgi:hypothetical protein